VFDIIGKENVAGRHAVLCDDEIDTASSAAGALESLMRLDKPPKDAVYYATHGTFSGPANDRLAECAERYGLKVVVTDTIPQDPQPWKEVVSAAPLLAHCLDRVQRADSVSALFDPVQFERILYGEKP